LKKIKKNTNIEKLKKTILSEKKSAWENEEKGIDIFAEDYMKFLNYAKTERLAANFIVNMAVKAGYEELKWNGKISNGGKYWFLNKSKSVILIHKGSDDILKGFNLIATHIDAPRIDLKQNPLIEDSGIALFKTHYYGGIKKYHWFNIPLAIHGVVVKKDGEVVNINIGEKDTDPVFLIPDLLPHLSRKTQENKKILDAYTGEHLNLIAGTQPYKITKNVKEKDQVKLNVMNILYKEYGITESDFTSAELELVPAYKSRWAGVDKSLIAGYGHDDRACSYASLKAFLDIKNVKRTCVAVFADKEEIGSEGITSLRSLVLTDILALFVSKFVKNYDEILLRKVISSSFAVSGDVDAAMDPTWKEVNEPHNNAKIGGGVSINKFTGHGGKYMANDANAEYLAKIRKLFDENQVVYQFTELGKVDEGGGGTVAKYLAKLGMEVVDCGTPVLGMHSPYELVSKVDLFQTFKAYKVFFENIK